MIEEYLTGSTSQSLERIRQLRDIIQGQYPREYDGLRQICLTRLDEAQNDLQRLSRENVVDGALQTPRRVREFKRIVEKLHAVEGIGVFALNRAGSGDDFLNRLITDLCREIRYPVVTPVISQMSQDYFHIYPEFNLLCLPLIESRFLLHLPDIYHELCHSFHRPHNANLPKLEPYHLAFKKSLFSMVEHFQAEIVAAERLRKPEGKLFQLQLWRTCWVRYWMEELFCDLFGVLTAGPAFVWSHYHLCVKRGGDPFDTPLMFSATHPADDARMKAMLKMLSGIDGYDQEAASIEGAWKNFNETMGYAAEPEYSQCFSEKLISEIVGHAKEGITGIEIQIIDKGQFQRAVDLLNRAWKTFWDDPASYQTWEAKQLDSLRSSLSA